MTDPRPILPTPFKSPHTVTLHNAAGQTASLRYEKGEQVLLSSEEIVGPPVPPTQGNFGNYGDGWPTVPSNAKEITPGVGNHNNIKFGGASVIRGGTFQNDNGDYGLGFTDCDGTLFIVGADFTRNRQGLMVRMTRADIRAPRVCLINCLLADNYVENLHGLPAELAGYFHTKMGTSFFGLYGNITINSGWNGDYRTRAYDPTQYDHDWYIKGDWELEALDNLSIRPSSQWHKGMGRSFTAKRNVILEPAIGMGCGQEKEGQYRPNDPLSIAIIQGNLIYGAEDLPADDQKLGWGIAVQGADLLAEGNIICSPSSENQNLPAFRFNECDGLVDKAVIRNNDIYGYKNVVEIDSKNRSYAPHILMEDNRITSETGMFKVRRQGSGDKVYEDSREVRYDPRITLDVDAIEAKARRREITAADVLAMARAQIGVTQ